MIRKMIVLAAVLLFALPRAHADEASKRAKIEEMFTVLKVDKTMKQMMDMGLAQGKQTAQNMMGDRPMTPADQKIMDDYLAKLYVAVSDVLSWEKLKPAYVDLYASAYSEEEVDGIVAFYKSPVGQVLLEKTPELITKSSTIVNSRMKEFAPRMREITEDMAKQMAAAHADKAPAK
jgi:hypothetical protein